MNEAAWWNNRTGCEVFSMWIVWDPQKGDWGSAINTIFFPLVLFLQIVAATQGLAVTYPQTRRWHHPPHMSDRKCPMVYEAFLIMHIKHHSVHQRWCVCHHASYLCSTGLISDVLQRSCTVQGKLRHHRKRPMLAIMHNQNENRLLSTKVLTYCKAADCPIVFYSLTHWSVLHIRATTFQPQPHLVLPSLKN